MYKHGQTPEAEINMLFLPLTVYTAYLSVVGVPNSVQPGYNCMTESLPIVNGLLTMLNTVASGVQSQAFYLACQGISTPTQ